MATAFGQKIKLLREEKGYTLRQLGDLTGSSSSYIWELENNLKVKPSAQKVASIADCLGVTPDYLLDYNDHITAASAVDSGFYHKYLSLSEDTKHKIRAIVDVLAGSGE